jgi:YD repeat-containing protein
MPVRQFVLAICCIAFFSCNSEKKDTTPTPPPNDLVRDGLKGRIKQYLHEEYPAVLQDTTWVRKHDSAIVRSQYRYDTAGRLTSVRDYVVNQREVNVRRAYKYAPGKPDLILRYEDRKLASRTVRQWAGNNSYSEKTYRHFIEADTINWESKQDITLNKNHQLAKSAYTLRTGDDMFTATSFAAYHTDNTIRSRTIVGSGGDSTVINYTILRKDDKGNPIHILKQYPATGQSTLVIESYEYY